MFQKQRTGMAIRWLKINNTREFFCKGKAPLKTFLNSEPKPNLRNKYTKQKLETK